MESLKLLPKKFKILGWILFLPSLILGLIMIGFGLNFESLNVQLPVFYSQELFVENEGSPFFKTVHVDLMENFVGILIIVGGLLVGFSREKDEDEYINLLRLKSMFWSLKWSYIFLLILFLTVFGFAFLSVLMIMIYFPLVLYIFKFNFLMWRNEK